MIRTALLALFLATPAAAEQLGAGPVRMYFSKLNLPPSGDCSATGSYNIDSNTLYVDCANNRVGVLTASPILALDVNGSGLFRSTLSVSGDFSVGGSTTLVTVGGRIGVGTASPLSTLDVNGAVTVRDAITSTSSGTFVTGLEVKNNKALAFRLANDTNNAGEIFADASNDLLFRTNSGFLRFKLSGSAGNSAFYVPLTVSASSTTLDGAVTVTGSNSLGIGTANPATKLHMSSGTLLVDGSAPKISIGPALPCSTCTFHVQGNASLGYTEITSMTVVGTAAIGGGSAIAKITKTATASTDLGGAITATCTAETNFSITGVAVGDACIVTTPAALAATDWVVCRTLLDNVALKYCTQGVAIDPAAMVFHITTIEY